MRSSSRDVAQAADATCKLDVLHLNCYALGVDGGQVGCSHTEESNGGAWLSGHNSCLGLELGSSPETACSTQPCLLTIFKQANQVRLSSLLHAHQRFCFPSDVFRSEFLQGGVTERWAVAESGATVLLDAGLGAGPNAAGERFPQSHD